jgi:hypothetical protein
LIRKQSKADGKLECYKGDSWFTSVTVAEWMTERGFHYTSALKTNHRVFPKEELEEKMKDWCSGSYLVMECISPKIGKPIIAIAYKYNKRKVLCFLATKNAGATKPGTSYLAKFTDSMGNICVREVERPAVVADYICDSNIIDNHNHVQQGELRLENVGIEHQRPILLGVYTKV